MAGASSPADAAPTRSPAGSPRCPPCPAASSGAKPAAVCRWIFALLGAGPGATLESLFPGSGAVGRAWAAYINPSCEASCDVSASPPTGVGRRGSARLGDDPDVGLGLLPGAEDLAGLVVGHRA